MTHLRITKVHISLNCQCVNKSCLWRRCWIRVYLEVQYCRSQHHGTYSNKHKVTNRYQHGHKAESFILIDPSLNCVPRVQNFTMQLVCKITTSFQKFNNTVCLCFRSYTSHSFSEHTRTQIKIKSDVLQNRRIKR
jgi:hypothetical protein